MAETPTTLARLPYTFRVLAPALAGSWPGGVTAGFTVVTLVSLILACLALHAYQRAIGLSVAAALAGALLFAVSGGSIRMLTTPTYVDAPTYLVEAAAFLFLFTGRFWPFVATVTLGTLNRETALLLIPLALVAAPRPWQAPARRLVLVAFPLGAFLLAIAAKLWVGGALAGAVPLAALAPYPRTFRQDLPRLTDLFDLFSTFGVVWLLALKNLPGPTAFQRRALLFGALVALQLLVSRGDEGRNLSHLFVLVIPLATLEVDRLLASGWPARRLLAALFVVACAASMVHFRWAFVESPTLRYGLVAAGSAVALAIVIARRWARPGVLTRYHAPAG